ncbi:helix-turn-helix domain-containing protein [uncultured Alistipes sp.]|uniref:helix-turn-helix domain-containing protein n=1 Tax=uncultured Alistipes sp. TaxID=538949 RepID=UPI00261E2341|nr:helix-turn-helix domain-containing protein [uncultured Alistipes sp.]
MDKQSIFRTDERPEALLRTLEQLEKDLDRCVELNRPMLGGERYLTDRELSERLKISRRTLQEHRSSHEIPYYCVCGKILYRESDIERFLEERYFGPVRR